MTPEQEERAQRLADRLKAYAEHGIPGAIYELCCELEALSVAALAVRSFWGSELVDSDAPPEDRLNLLHTVSASVRIGTIASSTMAALEPLLGGGSIEELQRALRWLAGPNSPSGHAGIDRFCREIATQTPKGGADAAREFLQRMYDRSPDEPQEGADG
jgi:hypothetical protein